MSKIFEEQLSQMSKIGILPVFCPTDDDDFAVICEAIKRSPVRIVEITQRNEKALSRIEEIKKIIPDITVGAGTVISEKTVDDVIDAGADFIVAPGYTPSLIEKAAKRGIKFLPGCATPTDIQNAYISGGRVFKFFPAQCMGGVEAIKLYAAMLPDVLFLPTGGITENNLSDYTAYKNVLACGGSYMLPKNLRQAGDVDGVLETILRCLEKAGRYKAI